MSMNQRGLLTNFLICKVGVALAALLLVSAVLGMSGSFARVTERDDFERVANSIGCALRTIDGIPGEVQLERKLPSTGRIFGLTITGTYSNGAQVIRIGVGGRVERVVMLAKQVNGGEFKLSHKSPTAIRLTKTDQIHLELI